MIKETFIVPGKWSTMGTKCLDYASAKKITSPFYTTMNNRIRAIERYYLASKEFQTKGD